MGDLPVAAVTQSGDRQPVALLQVEAQVPQPSEIGPVALQRLQQQPGAGAVDCAYRLVDRAGRCS